jgi:hypothetical protein
MTKCSQCGSTILFGSKRDGALRFCSDPCWQKSVLLRATSQVPAEIVDQYVRATHSGDCPKCHGPGPVDVHTSYRVWSAVVVTAWSSRPQVCCASCGRKAKVADALFCLLLGWWGIPFGLAITPLQIGYNLIGLTRGPDPTRPSDQLRNLICLQLAKSAHEELPHGDPVAPPIVNPPRR